MEALWERAGKIKSPTKGSGWLTIDFRQEAVSLLEEGGEFLHPEGKLGRLLSGDQVAVDDHLIL